MRTLISTTNKHIYSVVVPVPHDACHKVVSVFSTNNCAQAVKIATIYPSERASALHVMQYACPSIERTIDMCGSAVVGTAAIAAAPSSHSHHSTT
eukprot:11719-Heterococcus_DN1.PRE.10